MKRNNFVVKFDLRKGQMKPPTNIQFPGFFFHFNCLARWGVDLFCFCFVFLAFNFFSLLFCCFFFFGLFRPHRFLFVSQTFLFFINFPGVNLLMISFGVEPDRITLFGLQIIHQYLSRGNFTTIPSPPMSASEV